MTSQWSQDDYIKAYRFAALAHAGQTVPGTDISYLMHVSLVSIEVIAALNGEQNHAGNLAVQCALLHDVVEDTDVTYTQIANEFGRSVADGVLALSKDPAVAKERRLTDSLARIRLQPEEIWMVKLADRITNLQPPPPHWTHDKAVRYREEAIEIHGALGLASAVLSARLLKKIDGYQLSPRHP